MPGSFVSEYQFKAEIYPFGIVDGIKVFCWTLRNKNGVELVLTNYGATLISLKTPDRDGKFQDIVLGYDNLDGYVEGKAYLGGTIGRYGNRIAKSRFSLDGTTYSLGKNEGENCLHGGNRGFDKVMWDATDVTTAEAPALQFRYLSKNGEEGFPGNLEITVTYTLTAKDELRIDYDVLTDRATVQNPTHHSYFNLAGGGSILDHQLQLKAGSFTPVDEALIPTGELRSVEGTPFDFRTPIAIGERINHADRQLALAKGYDHNWVIDGESGSLPFAAKVHEPTSGRCLEVLTTEPGIQFYSGNFLNGDRGKRGTMNGYRTGFCLETQHFPDSPNIPHFPTTVLRPGERYKSTTAYRFFTD
jgi:aldose 1-epimerase